MGKTMIQLLIRQGIDATATTAFAKQVFHDSYEEFLLQSQVYNPAAQYRTFAEIVAQQPKANSLHYKTGFAVGLYIQSLNYLVPDAWDTLGNIQLSFERHQFKIIASDIHDRQVHKVAILYYTAPLLLHSVIGEYLLLGFNDTTDTFTLRLNQDISVCSYAENV
jgi:hypothetical protein